MNALLLSKKDRETLSKELKKIKLAHAQTNTLVNKACEVRHGKKRQPITS